MIKNVSFVIILLALFSCSAIKPISSDKRGYNKSSNDGVDLILNDGSKKSVDIIPQEETVRVGDRGGDVFVGATDSGQTQQPFRRLRIAVNFGPGIYRTINYVSVLKILEKKNLAPDILTGTGMGAIVAAMYATGMTPEAIEWNFYRFLREKRNNRPYEKDWLEDVDEMLLTKLKNVNLQDTKKKFFITLYDHTSKKTYYFDKGNMRELLMLNLRLSNNYTLSKTGQKYSAAFEKEVFNARLLRQLGAEFTVAIDALGSKFDFEATNEFLIGIYARAAGRIAVEKKDFDVYVALPLSQMPLDTSNESQLYMQKSYEFMNKQSPLIQKKLQVIMENLNSSGNQ